VCFSRPASILSVERKRKPAVPTEPQNHRTTEVINNGPGQATSSRVCGSQDRTYQTLGKRPLHLQEGQANNKRNDQVVDD